jgi:hypothetical protein
MELATFFTNVCSALPVRMPRNKVQKMIVRDRKCSTSEAGILQGHNRRKVFHPFSF